MRRPVAPNRLRRLVHGASRVGYRSGFGSAAQPDIGHEGAETRVAPQQFAGHTVEQRDIAGLERPARRDRFDVLLFVPLCLGCIRQLIKIYGDRVDGEIRLALAFRDQPVAVSRQQPDEIVEGESRAR